MVLNIVFFNRVVDEWNGFWLSPSPQLFFFFFFFFFVCLFVKVVLAYFISLFACYAVE